MKSASLPLLTTCASGLEELCGQEITECGGRIVESSRGLVWWRGPLESAYRLCLWSRFASRVLLEIARFPVRNTDSIYQNGLGISWDEHMGLSNTFAVGCTLGDCSIRHSRYAALKLKDALVDSFRKIYGKRPSVDARDPDIRFHLHIHRDSATVSLDLSGQSLHRRGYRAGGGGLAPLKESLAAAIVVLAGWNRDVPEDTVMLDPMCGSGTLLIEAALIYGDSAPGLSRSRFGLMSWKQHDEKLWSSVVTEALEREDTGMERKWPLFLGYDADPAAVAIARQNIQKAGLSDRIVIKQAQLARLGRPAARGFIVSNPPYGERVLEVQEAGRLYQALGRIMRRELYGWRAGILASNPDLTQRMGIKWQDQFRLMNGALACRLLCGDVPQYHEKEENGFRWKINPPDDACDGEAFANRLRKNLKKVLKWAGRHDVTCFRVYDRDIPEFNVSIDLYEKWVVVHEYAPPATVDAAVSEERFRQVLQQTRTVLGAGRDRVFVKRRRRQKRGKQYQKVGSSGKMHVVREGKCYLLVNFTDYVDTGLFLDHRPIRRRIGQEAQGRRFLNLFGYTGAATVHAATGGAESTLTVDLSASYLAWCRQNLCLNGFGGPAHETIRADCLEWLSSRKGMFDIIFADPPTYSNTSKKGIRFDVQKDHVRLIDLSMRLLAPGGLMFFSCNYRRFRLDKVLGERYSVKDITRATIPFDFARNSRVHQCWEITHR